MALLIASTVARDPDGAGLPLLTANISLPARLA